MIFRQLFDPQSSTYTYLLADQRAREAVLIDPVFEQVRRDAALIERARSEARRDARNARPRRSRHRRWLLKQRSAARIAIRPTAAREGADRYLSTATASLSASATSRCARRPATPRLRHLRARRREHGVHRRCLLIRGSGRTDFQQGDARAMYRSVHEQILTLPRRVPALSRRTIIAASRSPASREERALQSAARRRDRRGRLRRLHEEPRPAASEADRHRGARQSQMRPARRRRRHRLREPNWAPLTFHVRRHLGDRSRTALEEHARASQIVDVRERDEYVGPLGHIRGASLIPLGELPTRTASLRGPADRRRVPLGRALGASRR